MKPTLPLLASIGASLALAGCAAGPGPRYSDTAIDRALSSATYAAQPSLIVAREVEFARAAREDGQWTAFRAFAADGAVLHGRNGPVAAKPLLARLDDPEKAVQWSPRMVAMSCDGKLAISKGRFLDPEGFVGNYVTVWQRKRTDDEYKWVYDAGGRDDPQPVREDDDEDAIVVTAFDTIQGLVADCPEKGETVPVPPITVITGASDMDFSRSADNTLQWQWVHFADGGKVVQASYWKDGEWQPLFNQSLAAPTD